jgi:isoleucyl-tRNA synthetase
VSAEDGLGIVHMAPAFGADDYAAGQRHGLAFVHPVDARGRFPEDLPLVGGRFVKDADPRSSRSCSGAGPAVEGAQFVHSYPHCWRCRTPLLYYARGSGSWTTAFKDRMMARNAAVDWHPPEIGIRPVRRMAESTTWIGPSRAIATGERRCRSGSTTPIQRKSR